MTINEVLTEVDELKPNMYDDKTKIRWISVLEGKIVDEIFSTHVLANRIDFNGYTVNDINTELLVGDTYADLYKFYVFAQIDLHNGELNRYQGSMNLFNETFHDFAKHYNKTNLPLSGQLKVF